MSEVMITKEDDVTTIKLNRPERHNAMTPLMIRELTEAFKHASSDPKLRAIVLTGAGPSFCSGGDLEWMRSTIKYKLEENLKDAENLFEMYAAAASCPVPVIGYIEGNTYGGGLGLVAVCDVAVAEESAMFCFSECKIGLVPAVISSFVMRKMKPNKSREYMLTARPFDAMAALQAGLVEFVGKELEATEYVQSTLKCVRDCGPESVRETKRLLDYVHNHKLNENRDESIRVISERRVSDEGQEGLNSFLQKRKPAWVK